MHFLIKSIFMMSIIASSVIYSFFRFVAHLSGDDLYVRTVLFMSNTVSLIIVSSVIIYMVLRK